MRRNKLKHESEESHQKFLYDPIILRIPFIEGTDIDMRLKIVSSCRSVPFSHSICDILQNITLWFVFV